MPPPIIDIRTHTHSRVKMKIVAMPPPSIDMSTCFKVEISMDMSTHTVQDGDCCCIAVPPPSMDMSTHTQLKMEIVAPPPNTDISTHSRFKMEIVAVPPPSIDRSTHTRLKVETVPPSSIPLLFHPGLQVELQNSLNYTLIFLNKTVTLRQVKLASRIGKTQQNCIMYGKIPSNR